MVALDDPVCEPMVEVWPTLTVLLEELIVFMLPTLSVVLDELLTIGGKPIIPCSPDHTVTARLSRNCMSPDDGDAEFEPQLSGDGSPACADEPSIASAQSAARICFIIGTSMFSRGRHMPPVGPREHYIKIVICQVACY